MNNEHFDTEIEGRARGRERLYHHRCRQPSPESFGTILCFMGDHLGLQMEEP